MTSDRDEDGRKAPEFSENLTLQGARFARGLELFLPLRERRSWWNLLRRALTMVATPTTSVSAICACKDRVNGENQLATSGAQRCASQRPVTPRRGIAPAASAV